MRSYGKIGYKILAAAVVLSFLLQTAVCAAPSGPGVPAAEPSVQAQGAAVINAATGEILYGKNANTRYYPASITKLMTALLVIERCSLDETVTFSGTATTNLEAGAVTLNMTEGDTMTVRQCLYALLLKSANDVGNALAEHVSGSVSAFADLMNQKAASLGCSDTHFVNPHGLNDSNHYTTPYDMALIAAAAFRNRTLCEINTTLSYQLPATKKNKAMTITMGHKMMYPNDSRYYEGIIGGKTGFTSLAGNTLVTGAERNGVRLVAVVMKASGTHYTDTKALLDYGFAKMAAGGASGASAGPGSSQGQTGPGSGQGQNGSGSGDVRASSGPGGNIAPASSEPGSDGAQGAADGAVRQAPAAPGGSAPQASASSDGAVRQAPAASGGTAPQASASSDGSGRAVLMAPDGNSQAEGGTGTAAPGSQEAGWHRDGTGWYYVKTDGRRAAGEWLLLDDADYWIDADGYMAVGWRLFDNGDWYYFRGSGAMAVNRWVEDKGKWFYLGSSGAMLKNTTTPDGYVLDAAGAWITE